MSDELTLYTHPMSRGRMARWMLEEVGAPYHTHYLEYGGSMKSPDYLALNPMGKVPALRHGNTVVTECAAICAYLADAFPQSQLAPEVAQRGAYYRWLFFAAGPLEAAIMDRSRKLAISEREAMTLGYGSYEAVLNALEGALQDSDYIAGATFTAADVYVGSQIGWGLQFNTIETRPAFSAYWDRISRRDAYQRANAKDDAAIQASESH